MAGTANGKMQTMMARSTLLIISFVLLAIPSGGNAGAQARRDCGTHVEDWCPSHRGDRCNRHKTTAACKADLKCYGMPYRGESFIPCFLDERGFASNCPTVGCTSRRPAQKPPR